MTGFCLVRGHHQRRGNVYQKTTLRRPKTYALLCNLSAHAEKVSVATVASWGDLRSAFFRPENKKAQNFFFRMRTYAHSPRNVETCGGAGEITIARPRQKRTPY
jgi:hypothetical protein